MQLPYHVYDVFTDTAFSGNPLAIVTGADDLTTAQMQTIAREFNLSETIFVMAPKDPANNARVRIFFPTAEIPFAGHPTIGCALYLASVTETSEIRLEEEAGLVPVTIKNGRAEFTAPILPRLTETQIDQTNLAHALDLDAADLAPTAPRVGTGGPAFLFAQLSSLAALANARPIEPHWSEIMTACDVNSAYLYVVQDNGYRARMFSPTAGIPEDPATGSASDPHGAFAGNGWLAGGRDPPDIAPRRRNGPSEPYKRDNPGRGQEAYLCQSRRTSCPDRVRQIRLPGLMFLCLSNILGVWGQRPQGLRGLNANR